MIDEFIKQEKEEDLNKTLQKIIPNKGQGAGTRSRDRTTRGLGPPAGWDQG